jgi:hypothetical protein
MKERFKIGHLSVDGQSSPTRLADMLELLPSRATRSSWHVEPFSDQGEPCFEMVSEHDGLHALEQVAEAGERISFTKLAMAATDAGQIIWGVFSATDGGDGEQPWMKLIAFDGGWELETADDKVKRRIERAFKTAPRASV